jgi:hypothetical protein
MLETGVFGVGAVGCGCGGTTSKPFTFRPVVSPYSCTSALGGDFLVLVEGIKMKAKAIPKRRLVAAWKTLSSKPLPNVKALRLSDADFNHALEHHRCLEDCLRELQEWGRLLSTGGTDACIYNGDETDGADYVILIREKPYHSLNEILIHELGHIARGDL